MPKRKKSCIGRRHKRSRHARQASPPSNVAATKLAVPVEPPVGASSKIPKIDTVTTRVDISAAVFAESLPWNNTVKNSSSSNPPIAVDPVAVPVAISPPLENHANVDCDDAMDPFMITFKGETRNNKEAALRAKQRAVKGIVDSVLKLPKLHRSPALNGALKKLCSMDIVIPEEVFAGIID
mmetsp:Transcript_27339/g.41847  ORF Transcript_27339/g.41847 Transcript_27339/m.41847 type:complete len:181 (-) Transcript_27339:245-787(-)|eukprot:CAMPEP_0195293328 /NCGR_PEP_ID=MMETSP0707-20130614/12172_1 /TAXON_ID=33640 /ORGANISM="Asterionellopsis glacialis, Strain CCMP134" /LENGTH=180 /DNA_ID=CAMNT_0040354013 /DNA_START=90 /DNA_END=632 /DNA_ORIENTATION=-